MKKEEYIKMNLLEETHFWFVGKQIFVQKILDRVLAGRKKRTILDIGCGTGAVTKLLEDYGNVYAIEKNPLACEYARKKGVRVRSGEIERIPYAKNTFDCVSVIDVLYHKNVKNIGKALQECGRVLKKNGTLICVDSAMPYLMNAHDKSVQGKRRFYLSEMIHYLERAGFTPAYSSYLFFFLFPVIVARRVLWSRLFTQKQSDVFQVNPVLNFVLICILKIESLLLPHISYPFGSSLVVIARKSI